MAILGYNDVLQYGGGASDPWDSAPEINVEASSGGSAVGTAPVANLLNRSIAQVWQRTGISAAGSVQLRLRLFYLPNFADSRTNFGAFGILGIKQTPVDKSQGFEQDVNFRLRISNTGFALSDLYDQTRTFHAQETSGLFPRQVWFDLVSGDQDPALSATGGNPAITPPNPGTSLYLTIDITRARTLSNTWSIQIGRLAAMTTVVGRFEPTITRSFQDETEVIRSFGGTPYALRGQPMRRIEGSLVGLTDAAVTGFAQYETGATQQWPSSITAVNLLAGSRGEVVLIPQIYGKSARTADSGTRYPSAWQTQPLFGRLDGGVNTSRVATTSSNPAPGSPNGALWQASFGITETPLG